MSASVRLSAETFALTWHYAKVGDLPSPLYVPLTAADSYGSTHAELRAFEELRALAGNDRRGFTADLEGSYQLLARAPLEYYGWFVRADGTTFSALLACHPQRALLAVVDGDAVAMHNVAPNAGAETLVSLLPEYAPADFRPASARLADVLGEGHSATPSRRKRHDGALSTATQDITTLRQVFGTSAIGKGQLYVAGRTESGRRSTCAAPLHYIDPQQGRILFYTSDNGGGEYVTAQPGTPTAIAGNLSALRETL